MHSCLHFSDDLHEDEQLSTRLHQLLNNAGFTEEKAEFQIRMADFIEGIAREVTGSDIRMTGSFADGWANSLVQVNGRTAADSDIDFTVLLPGDPLHLEGGCTCENQGDVSRLKVVEGHAQLQVPAGEFT